MVYATARNLDAIEDLADAGCEVLALDVLSEHSMRAALHTLAERRVVLDALVNNAGYGLYGPIEQQQMTDIRVQFETNVFGVVRMTQLVLPMMRTAGRGRILNISSVAGRTVFPGGGFYHASKFALEALSDALRIEVRSFGIDIVLIEPGPVRTPWGDKAKGSIALGDSGGNLDPYLLYKSRIFQMLSTTSNGIASRFSSSPQHIAAVIERALRRRHPRPRYLIGLPAHAGVLLHLVLPDRLQDAFLAKVFRL
jgi:short-subunit dehydrogenase